MPNSRTGQDYLDTQDKKKKKKQQANPFKGQKVKVNATGDRWFIPYNDNGTTAAQAAQCSKVVGNTTDGTVAGAEST